MTCQRNLLSQASDISAANTNMGWVIFLLVVNCTLLIIGIVAIILLTTLNFGNENQSLDPGTCFASITSNNLSKAIEHYKSYLGYALKDNSILLGVSKYTIINNIVLPSNIVQKGWLTLSSGSNETGSNSILFSITCNSYDIYLDEYQIAGSLTPIINGLDQTANIPVTISATQGSFFATEVGDHQVVLTLGPYGIDWDITPDANSSSISSGVSSSGPCHPSIPIYIVNDTSEIAFSVLVFAYSPDTGPVQQISITKAFNNKGYAYITVPKDIPFQILFVMQPTSNNPYRTLVNVDLLTADGSSPFYSVRMNDIQTALLVCPIRSSVL